MKKGNEMKRRLIWIASLLLAAGCADTNEEQLAPVTEGGEQEPVMETFHVRVGAVTGEDEESRASFDADLRAYWESGDRIKGLMGLAKSGQYGSGSKTYNGDDLVLESGVGTSRGIFSGQMTNPTGTKDAQYFHFIYPAQSGTLSLQVNKSFVNASKDHPVTCTVAIPAEQEGRWIPYMWATTAERTGWDNLANVPFNILNGALAIRVYESDRTTPKQLSAISVRATGAADRLVGTWTATTNDALSADKFQLSATGSTIEAAGLERIEPLNGLYEYRLNVVPGSVEGLEITLIGADGTKTTRHANAKEFKANTRSGLNVYWDDATITMDRAASWYEDRTLEGGLLYLDATVAGASASAVEEIGYTIDGTEHPVASGLTLTERIALPAGRYTVGVYAKVNGKTLVSDTKEMIVTPVPTLTNTIRTSCTNNGAYRTTNALNGDTIEAAYTLSDPFFSGLLSSVDLVCDTGTLGSLLQNTTLTAPAPGSYAKCRVVATLQNGYAFEGASYDTHVSGIPCNYQFYDKNDNDVARNGWICNNTKWSSSYLDIFDNNARAVKTFNMLQAESVSYRLNLKYYFSNALRKQSATVYAGAASSQNGPSNNASSHAIQSNISTGTGGRTDLNGAVRLDSTTPWFMISHNNPSKSGVGSIYLGLYSIDLKYANPDE